MSGILKKVEQKLGDHPNVNSDPNINPDSGTGKDTNQGYGEFKSVGNQHPNESFTDRLSLNRPRQVLGNQQSASRHGVG